MKGKVLYKNYNHFLSGGKHVYFFCKVEYFNMKRHGDLTLLLGQASSGRSGYYNFHSIIGFPFNFWKFGWLTYFIYACVH